SGSHPVLEALLPRSQPVVDVADVVAEGRIEPAELARHAVRNEYAVSVEGGARKRPLARLYELKLEGPQPRAAPAPGSRRRAEGGARTTDDDAIGRAAVPHRLVGGEEPLQGVLEEEGVVVEPEVEVVALFECGGEGQRRASTPVEGAIARQDADFR